MNRCVSCGGTVAEFDRFCGDCGAPVAGEPELLLDVEPERTHGNRRRRGLILASAAVVAFLIAAGAALYWTSIGGQPAKVIRFALRDFSDGLQITEPGEADESDKPVPTPTPSDTDQPAETDSPIPTETAAQGASGSTATSGLAIDPGNWAFSTLLFNVTKVDMSDNSFRLNREGIGISERNTQCITPAVAGNPRLTAFPFRPGMDCRISSFSMSDGRYRASMTCNFPQYGGRRPVEAEGRYSANDVSVDLRVRAPAEVVSGEFQDPPEIYIHYRITGRLTQPCS